MRNLGQAARATTLATDVHALDVGVAASDVQRKEGADHLDILARLYLVDEAPGWVLCLSLS